METDILIIGGSAAGIMVAKTAAKHYPDKEITVVRKEEKVLIPCGIPYTIGTVGGVENNIIPDKAVTNVADLIIDEVININKEEKKVKLKSGEEISYQKLVLGTGSKPFKPPIEGLNLNGVFGVEKDFDLLNEIKNKVNSSDNLVIIGGGFIGIEFADECRKGRDVNISIIEMRDHCLSLVCDKDVCIKVEEKLEFKGINLYQNTEVVEIVGDEKVEAVKFANGDQIPADIVILATGVVPNTELAQKAGINYDDKKGILVDKFMRTSDPDIFACGDCTEKPSFFGESFEAARLASIATTEGRVIGANLYELRRKKQESVGIFDTIVDDLAIGVAGLTKSQAEEAGMKVVVGEAEAVNRHPGKMPGAVKLGVKLIFREYDGVVIGAQVYGGDSVGEFTNVLGLAIEKEMTAEELAILQIGTHPALTASPIAYQLINAAEDAVAKL